MMWNVWNSAYCLFNELVKHSFLSVLAERALMNLCAIISSNILVIKMPIGRKDQLLVIDINTC